MEWNGATQNDAHFKIYELFISGIFHLIFLDHGWPWATEIVERKSTISGESEEDRDWNMSAAAACNTGRNLDSLVRVDNLNSNTESIIPGVVLNISVQVPWYLMIASLISFPLTGI